MCRNLNMSAKNTKMKKQKKIGRPAPKIIKPSVNIRSSLVGEFLVICRWSPTQHQHVWCFSGDITTITNHVCDVFDITNTSPTKLVICWISQQNHQQLTNQRTSHIDRWFSYFWDGCDAEQQLRTASNSKFARREGIWKNNLWLDSNHMCPSHPWKELIASQRRLRTNLHSKLLPEHSRDTPGTRPGHSRDTSGTLPGVASAQTKNSMCVETWKCCLVNSSCFVGDIQQFTNMFGVCMLIYTTSQIMLVIFWISHTNHK